MSTALAFVRLLGARIAPIAADEARTFGMANLFKQVGIYCSVGQGYEPEDIGSVLSYRVALDGQILEEGISGAGAFWAAADQRARGFPLGAASGLSRIRLQRRRIDGGTYKPDRQLNQPLRPVQQVALQCQRVNGFKQMDGLPAAVFKRAF